MPGMATSAGRPPADGAPAAVVLRAANMERLNSLEDFRATLGGRQGPPANGSSRFGKASGAVDAVEASKLEVAGAAAQPIGRPLGPSTPIKTTNAPPSANDSPAPASPSQRPGRPRSLSESGEDAHYVPSRSRHDPRRRITDGGATFMQTLVTRRNLKHLASSPEVAPTVWLHSPPRKVETWPHGTEHCPSRRRRTVTGTIDEEHPMLNLGLDNTATIQRLEGTVRMLSSQLAEAFSQEASLQRRVQGLEQQLQQQQTPPVVAQAGDEKGQLQLLNARLMADLRRKNRVLHQMSASLPMYTDEATLKELGPLRDVLSNDQARALIEMLCLGVSSEDLHLLLLGQSATGADLRAFLHLAGSMRATFKAAEQAEDAVKEVLVQDSAPGTPGPQSQGMLTRERMVQLLRENNVRELMRVGVDHSLLAEISLASLSDVDPWSIVNLLDGRIRRGGSFDVMLAPSLAGALAGLSEEEFGVQSGVAKILERLASRCSLSPMCALKARIQELEQANIELGAQLEDLRHVLHVKQCKWTAEKQGSAVSELWRLDSFGTGGLPSPGSPATSSPLGKVF